MKTWKNIRCGLNCGINSTQLLLTYGPLNRSTGISQSYTPTDICEKMKTSGHNACSVLLNEMAKADFRRKGTEFRTEKLLAKLKSVPIETFPNTAEREIIPYEDLWELILGHLK